MKKTILLAAVLVPLALPVWAKNFAFPKNDPAATVAIPDKWSTEEIEYGFEARSPDNDIYFAIETASAKSLDRMMKANEAWMKRNNIRVVGNPIESEFDLGGLKASLVRRPAKDDNGDTIVDFVFAQDKDRLIFITLWGSGQERDANADDIKSIQRSIKIIN